MRWWASYLREDYIKFHSFDSPWKFLMLHWPSSGMLSCYSFLMTPLYQILPWWVHCCLFMGLKTSSLDGARYSLIELPHDLLAPCNSCLLVVLENQPPVHIWLVDELSKLQSCLELCWFGQVLLPLGLQYGNSPFLLELAWESNHDTLPNGWCITHGTQPKWNMSGLGVPLLQLVTSKPLACCFFKLQLARALPSSF
jgi:hypothetical protein